MERNIVRFDLNVFEDIVKMCNRGSSRNFKLVRTDGGSGNEFTVKRCKTNSNANVAKADSSKNSQPLAETPIRGKSKRNMGNMTEVSSPALATPLKDVTPPAKKQPKFRRDQSKKIPRKFPGEDDFEIGKRKPAVESTENPRDEKENRDSSTSSTFEGRKALNDLSTASSFAASATTAHTGFHNPGLMCYMNSALQAIFAAAPVHDYLNSLTVDREDDRNKTLYCLTWLCKLLNRDQNLDNKVPLKGALNFLGAKLAQTRLEFDPRVQHDVHEFVLKLLDAMQEDIIYCDPSKDICKDLFLLTNSFLPVLCPSCGVNVAPARKSEHMIYHIDMQDTKDGESIQEIVDKNLEIELEKRCCQNDIRCGSQINQMPKVLLIGLKRYSADRQKIKTSLEISPDLILAKYKIDSNQKMAKKPVSNTMSDHTDKFYQLVGIVNHEGKSLNRGHYVSYVYDRFEEQWILCNDGKVRVDDISYALMQSSKDCYLLVYSEKETDGEDHDVFEDALESPSPNMNESEEEETAGMEVSEEEDVVKESSQSEAEETEAVKEQSPNEMQDSDEVESDGEQSQAGMEDLEDISKEQGRSEADDTDAEETSKEQSQNEMEDSAAGEEESDGEQRQKEKEESGGYKSADETKEVAETSSDESMETAEKAGHIRETDHEEESDLENAVDRANETTEVAATDSEEEGISAHGSNLDSDD